MQVAISTTRPFHSAMLANALGHQHAAVTLYTSAPRRFFRGLDPAARLRLVPSLLQTAMHLARFPASAAMLHLDSWLFDKSVATLLRPADLFIGWASAALLAGRAARRRGAHFVLDRACPHVNFQQRIVREQAALVGARFEPEPAWFRDRQLAEYEEAEQILVPSRYTADTFPAHQQPKLVCAPLFGRHRLPATTNPDRHPTFTVGVVGGDPLRKGYFYLLRAWQSLALPGARLLIRSDADFTRYPVLRELLAAVPGVDLVGYVPDINDFYQQCDLFVLPSVDDGFGMALFEAMGNAVPCIATRHCGSSELLTSGRDGLIVDPFSAEALAAAILTFYNDEDYRRSVADAGRQTAMALQREGGSELYSSAIAELLDRLGLPQQAAHLAV